MQATETVRREYERGRERYPFMPARDVLRMVKTITVAVTLHNPREGGAMEAPSLAELTAAALRREMVEAMWGVGHYRCTDVEATT